MAFRTVRPWVSRCECRWAGQFHCCAHLNRDRYERGGDKRRISTGLLVFEQFRLDGVEFEHRELVDSNVLGIACDVHRLVGFAAVFGDANVDLIDFNEDAAYLERGKR